MLMRISSWIVIICFAFSILFGDIASAYNQGQEEKPRIAVLPCTDTNAAAKSEGYGEAVSGMLMTELINGQVFQVVERGEINKIMEEIHFEQSGVVSSETAKEIGKLYGVDILVFGSVAKFGQLVETDIRLVETQSGEALLAEHASSGSGVEIRNMVETLARKIEKRYLGRLIEEVSIASNPSGADVFIDGVKEGTTPLTKQLTLGEHKIRITKQNYNVWEQNVMIVEAENNINANLTYTTAYLQAQADNKKREEERKTQSADDEEKEKIPSEAKKKGSKTLLYVLGGAVLIGGGVAALMMSKKSEEDNNSTVSITVTIPNH